MGKVKPKGNLVFHLNLCKIKSFPRPSDLTNLSEDIRRVEFEDGASKNTNEKSMPIRKVHKIKIRKEFAEFGAK